MERCTIVVAVRDRFSTTESCLEVLLADTALPFDLIFVCGGAPESVERNLRNRFAGKATLIFKPNFLNPAEARNIGLGESKTRLAVLMDNDVYVRPGWLEPLIECQRKTNAAMVVPIILEYGREIHTAGNDFYITHENGRTYAHKELRYHGMVIGDGSTNLKRWATDYGELHCQLVDVPTALRLGVYDENIQEVGECDSGLAWQKAGCSMWFEPKSIVNYELPSPGSIKAEDVKLFVWRWDMREILKGYQYFYQKWNIDITEHGNFRNFLLSFNNKLGLLPRIFPSAWALRVDGFLKSFPGELGKWLLLPVRFWRHFRSWQLGYYAWPESTRDDKWQLEKGLKAVNVKAFEKQIFHESR